MSEKVYCDICGGEITDVNYGVRIEDPIKVVLNKDVFDDVCIKCYRSLYEYVEELKKK